MLWSLSQSWPGSLPGLKKHQDTTHTRRTSPEATRGPSGSRAFTIGHLKEDTLGQAGEVNRAPSGLLPWAPPHPPPRGCQTSPSGVDSPCFQRECLRQCRFHTVCFSMTPVHPPHERGQHPKMFSTERAGAKAPSCCPLVSSVRCHLRINSQFEFKAHAAVWENKRSLAPSLSPGFPRCWHLGDVFLLQFAAWRQESQVRKAISLPQKYTADQELHSG